MTHHRHVVYGFVICLASLLAVFAMAVPAQAAETPAVAIDQTLVTWGTTLSLPNGAKAGIFPEALTAPAEAQWTISEAAVPTLPAHRTLLGNVYRLTMSGDVALNPTVARPLAISIPDLATLWIHQIWMYDRTTQQWSSLRTKFNPETKFAQAPTVKLDALYALVEDRQQQVGIASWYCRYHCSSRYPTMHGTSNDFPVGSMVTVRSLENGRTVNVKIVSGWGQPAGRVVDLSYAAFSALRPSNGGLTKVIVSPYTAPVSTSSGTTGSVHDKVETLPSLNLSGDDIPAPSAVQSVTFSVYDQTTGTVLADRQGDVVRPIASITKLMTAMVFLDTKTPFSKVVTYSSTDNATCSCLSIGPGETLTVRDLFYTTLVGSANNATNALVRSTGLTRAEFVDRMNAKATELGLSKAHFVDPTGLDPANVASATDVANMTAYALHQYEPIRYVTTRRSYSFTTINSLKPHTIQLRYSIYSRTLPWSNLTVTGGKTGYLDEALMTYTLRVKNSQGAQVIIVVLGSPSYAQRLNDVIALLEWAYGHHVWK